MAHPAVVVDLPLVPVIATSLRRCRKLALKKFHIADHFDCGGARLGDRPMAAQDE